MQLQFSLSLANACAYVMRKLYGYRTVNQLCVMSFLFTVGEAVYAIQLLSYIRLTPFLNEVNANKAEHFCRYILTD